jgi:hypothetical protein
MRQRQLGACYDGPFVLGNAAGWGDLAVSDEGWSLPVVVSVGAARLAKTSSEG